MKFQDRLKIKRQEAGMTQVELAQAVHVTSRTIQNYELGTRRPKNDRIIEQIADALHCSYEDLMGRGGTYIIQAQEKGGSGAARDIEEIVDEITGLFAGGTMDEASLDGVYRALTEAYWEAKDRNRKYTPGKYRTADSQTPGAHASSAGVSPRPAADSDAVIHPQSAVDSIDH